MPLPDGTIGSGLEVYPNAIYFLAIGGLEETLPFAPTAFESKGDLLLYFCVIFSRCLLLIEDCPVEKLVLEDEAYTLVLFVVCFLF